MKLHEVRWRVLVSEPGESVDEQHDALVQAGWRMEGIFTDREGSEYERLYWRPGPELPNLRTPEV